MSGLIARWARLSTLAASAGASLIGFIQSGAGAVARTMQAKARDVVSVKDFGAVGDGVADDTAAFNAALLAAKCVRVPAGQYRLAATVSMQQDGNVLSGDGDGSVLSYAGAGTVIDFNAKTHATLTAVKITSATAAIGVDCGAMAHNFRIERVSFDGNLAGVPAGFSTAAVQIERSFYGEIAHCDISYAAVGVYGFNECNGNFIKSNSIRQCITGIKISDTTANSDGNSIIGNEVETAAVGADYGIVLLGADSTMVIGNRLEITGTAHVHINSGAGAAQNNQVFANCLEGAAAAIILGDGVGVNQVMSTHIVGGRGAGAVTINADCLATRMQAAGGLYSGALTDNGYGSVIEIDPTNAKQYAKTVTSNTVKGVNWTVGGVATILDTGANYLQVNGAVGAHTLFAVDGRLRVAQGSLSAGGDSGGYAGTNTLSSASNVAARSTGVGTVKFTDAVNRDNIGFIKVYVGVTAYYVPIFAAP